MRAAPGPTAAAPEPAPPAPEPEAPPHREALVRLLARGERLDRAIVAQVRSLVGAKEHDTAVALAESLRVQPPTAELGHLAAGIAAARRGYSELAWEELRRLPRTSWAVHAPAEYVRSGLRIAPEEALREIRALAADDPPEVRAKSWHELLVAVWGRGESELARELFAIFERHAREDRPLWRGAELQRDWLRPWVEADPDSPTAPAPPGGRRTFAVMDYGHPSATKASANIGDHVQTIAALGHLVRHHGVRLHGREDLIDLLAQFRDRTRPERRRDDVTADVEVITAHRDASIYEPIPEDTWILCFGWFMHSLFRMRHGFPLHRNLRPVFVSFHCNKRELLTPEAIEYLKRYGPVGCRDWTTVDLLLSIGVPAFFSGCLTTTIDTVFPDLAVPPAADAPVAYVDVPAAEVPPGGATFHHSSDDGPAPLVRRERLRGAGAARALPARAPGRRHVAAALLPAGPLARHGRRLPAQEPLGRPLRRADRHRRRRVRRHPRRPARQARAGVRRDPRRPRRGGGLRAVARDHRRRRGGGRAAPPRGEPAGARRPGDHREDARRSRPGRSPTAVRPPPTPSTSRSCSGRAGWSARRC